MNGTILNLGPLEIITILVMALLVLGPERLPQLMRGIGSGLRRMRMMYVAFVTEFRNELQPIAEEVDKVTSEIQGELQAIREAADFRNVLQPVVEDIAVATDLTAPVKQLEREVSAPAWGFPPPPDPENFGPPAIANYKNIGNPEPEPAGPPAISNYMNIGNPEPPAAETIVSGDAAPDQASTESQGVSNSIGRVTIELSLDNPWSQIHMPVRSDQLDEDSPWRG